MEAKIEELMAFIDSLGVKRSALVDTEALVFNEVFRKQCERNVCGSYGKNWMCPPGVGEFSELKEKALQFKQGVLFQTVYKLRDSFDYKGMIAATEEHTKVFRAVLKYIREHDLFPEFLPLNVGPCTFCRECAYVKGRPCSFPEEAVASVEAYGIDVMALTKSCGIPYHYGVHSVACVSLILFNQGN